MAVWPSWPQPCMRPGLHDFQEKSLCSASGSASMSARRPTMLPLEVLRPRITPTTPVRPMPSWISSTPQSFRASLTRVLVYISSKPSSGWACRSRRSAVSSGWYCAMCANARPPALYRSDCMSGAPKARAAPAAGKTGAAQASAPAQGPPRRAGSVPPLGGWREATQGGVHSMPSCLAYAKARVDRKIQQVHHQIDHHKDQGDQAQVGGHHRNVGKGHGLDEQQAHAGPLEHGLGDDGEGNQTTQLQAGDGHHGHQRVLERMAEVDGAIGQTP